MRALPEEESGFAGDGPGVAWDGVGLAPEPEEVAMADTAVPSRSPAGKSVLEEHRGLRASLDTIGAALAPVLDDLGRHEESEHELLARALDGAIAARD